MRCRRGQPSLVLEAPNLVIKVPCGAETLTALGTLVTQEMCQVSPGWVRWHYWCWHWGPV